MRALIVDGEELFRLSLNEVVSVAGPFTNISHATSESNFLTITAHERSIDLVLMHPRSLGDEGRDCLTLARRLYPHASIIAFAAKPSSSHASDIIFVDRNIAVQDLVATIRQSLRLPALAVGRTAVPGAPDLSRIVGHNPLRQTASSEAENECLERLSHRQRQILLMAADGLANKEIAARLGIAEGTVKAHMHAIFKVLGVTNRTQAVVRYGGLARSVEAKPVGNDQRSDARAYQLGAL